MFVNRIVSKKRKIEPFVLLPTIGLVAGMAYLLFFPPGAAGLLLALAGLACATYGVTRESMGVYLLLWGPLLLGGLFRCAGIEKLGTVIAYPLAFSLLFLFKVQIACIPRKWKPVITWWIVTIIVLFVAYLYGPMTSYSISKLLFFVFYLTMAVIAFRFMIVGTGIDLFRLGIFGIASAVVQYASVGYRIPMMMPSSIFVPTGLRLTIDFHMDVLPETNVLAYIACSGILMICCGAIDKKLSKIENLNVILAVIIGLLIVFSVGQRLWMLAVVAGSISIVFCKPKKRLLSRSVAFIILGLSMMGFVFAIAQESRLIAPIYYGVKYKEKRISELIDRDRNWDSAINRIVEKPVCGHGLGGYYVDGYSSSGDGTYAHNLFLELFSETGLVGTAIILIPVLPFLLLGRRIGRFRTATGATLLPLLIMYFGRSLVSGDLKFSSHLIAITGILWCYISAAGMKRNHSRGQSVSKAQITHKISKLVVH